MQTSPARIGMACGTRGSVRLRLGCVSCELLRDDVCSTSSRQQNSIMRSQPTSSASGEMHETPLLNLVGVTNVSASDLLKTAPCEANANASFGFFVEYSNFACVVIKLEISLARNYLYSRHHGVLCKSQLAAATCTNVSRLCRTTEAICAKRLTQTS